MTNVQWGRVFVRSTGFRRNRCLLGDRPFAIPAKAGTTNEEASFLPAGTGLLTPLVAGLLFFQ